MRILLTQKTAYLPTWGGANKSNRLILETMVKRGHQCRAVALACGAQACHTHEAFRAALIERRIRFESIGPDAEAFDLNGVGITAVTESKSMDYWLVRAIRDFDPDWVLVASEDPGQVLLRTALKESPSRAVYLARTTLALPFGPDSPIHSRVGTSLLHRVTGIVVVSEYLREYFRRWANLDSIELAICPNGPGPFPNFGRFDSGFVTIINPCTYKGISIFAALARAMPDTQFAAVPTWGTTERDKHLLAKISNVRLLTPSDHIDDIYAASRILLVPSLWAEAKANVITEAMLRGIPVLASDAGGNSEAKLGIDYLLPVNPITEFHNELDERLLPMAKVPEQPMDAWLNALRDLLTSRASYERISIASRNAALAANEKQTVDPLEDYLAHLRRHPVSCEIPTQQ